MDKQFSYALSFVSEDSKGLVSEATKVLFENGFNIEDSSSTLLQGIFSMIFIVRSASDLSEKAVADMFRNGGFVPHVFKFSGERRETAGNHYSISVYGADKPGIVHAVTSVLAENGINITDLQTKAAGKQDSKVYIMVLEVAVPENTDEKTWTDALRERASKTGIDVTYKKIEEYEF